MYCSTRDGDVLFGSLAFDFLAGSMYGAPGDALFYCCTYCAVMSDAPAR